MAALPKDGPTAPEVILSITHGSAVSKFRGFVRIPNMEVIIMYAIPTSILLTFNPTNLKRNHRRGK